MTVTANGVTVSLLIYVHNLLFCVHCCIGAFLDDEPILCEECGKEFLDSFLLKKFNKYICENCKWVALALCRTYYHSNLLRTFLQIHQLRTAVILQSAFIESWIIQAVIYDTIVSRERSVIVLRLEELLHALTWHSLNPLFLSSRKAVAATCTKFWPFVGGIDCWSGTEFWANQSKGFWGGVRGKFFFDPHISSLRAGALKFFFLKNLWGGRVPGKFRPPRLKGGWWSKC